MNLLGLVVLIRAAWAVSREEGDLEKEEWTGRELLKVDTYLYGNGTQLFTPLGSWEDTDLFFVYVNRDMQVKVAHVKLNESEAAIHSDIFLVDAGYRTVASVSNMYSLGVDESGYIHIAGDMDEYPYFANRHEHLPERFLAKNCHCMIWKSAAAVDATAFIYQGDGPFGSCPIGTGFRRMRFMNDRGGRLYAQYRNIAIARTEGAFGVEGDRGLGMSRYNTTRGAWELVGAQVGDHHAGHFALVFEDNNPPGLGDRWYNAYYHDACFDPYGVLHVYVQLTGEAGSYSQPTYAMYASSSDGGRTFQKGDGTTVLLPMRVNSEWADRGDVVYHGPVGFSYQMATARTPAGELLAFLGHHGHADLEVMRLESGVWLKANGSPWPSPAKDGPHDENRVYYDDHGVPTMIGRDGVTRFASSEEVDVFFHALPWGQLMVDGQFFRRTGSLVALRAAVEDPGELSLVIVESDNRWNPGVITTDNPDTGGDDGDDGGFEWTTWTVVAVAAGAACAIGVIAIVTAILLY